MKHVVSRKATHQHAIEYVLLTLSVVSLSLSLMFAFVKGTTSTNVLLSIVALVLALFLLTQSFRIWILRYIFRPPRRRGECISESGWETVSAEREGVPIHAHMKWENIGSAPLILFLHGWSSDSRRSQNRSIGLEGFHILAMDLRGHGHSPDDQEFTALKCAKDAVTLLESLPKERFSNIAIYGHSLGAFIALKISSEMEGILQDRLKCVVLESPMTNYNLIFAERFNSLSRLLKPLLFHWTKNAWKKIHPEEVVDHTGIMVPGWGIPKVRTLVVQAANDSRLGMEHYNLLIAHLEEGFEAHVIDDLRHSGDSEHRGRTLIAKKFLEESLL